MASKFTYLSYLWLQKLDYTFKLEVDDDYHPSKWFSSTANKCQGQLHELLTVIPKKYHSYMKDEVFISTVSVP